MSDSSQTEMQQLLDLEDQLHVDLRKVTFTYLAPDIHGDGEGDPSLDYIGRFYDAFVTLDERLTKQAYLLGESITLADVSWFITLHRLRLAGYPMEQHTALDAYFKKLSSRPAFKTQAASGPVALRLAGFVYRRLRKFKKSLRNDFQAWSKGAGIALS